MADRERLQGRLRLLVAGRRATARQEVPEQFPGSCDCGHLDSHLSSECFSVPFIEPPNNTQADIPSSSSDSWPAATTTTTTQQNSEASFDLTWADAVDMDTPHISVPHIDAYNTIPEGSFLKFEVSTDLQPYPDAPRASSGIFDPILSDDSFKYSSVESSDMPLDAEINREYVGIAAMVPVGSLPTASFPGAGVPVPAEVSPNESSSNALVARAASRFDGSRSPSLPAQLDEHQVSIRASQAGTSETPPVKCVYCHYTRQRVIMSQTPAK